MKGAHLHGEGGDCEVIFDHPDVDISETVNLLKATSVVIGMCRKVCKLQVFSCQFIELCAAPES
eukprot:3752525-Amphidinium_carterae.1